MRDHHRWICVLLLPCYLSACATWQRNTQPLPVTLGAERIPELRFTLANGPPSVTSNGSAVSISGSSGVWLRITLTDPRLVGDSIVGTGKLSAQQLRYPSVRDGHPRVAIALADVQTVEHPATTAVATTVLVMGFGAVAIGLGALFLHAISQRHASGTRSWLF